MAAQARRSVPRTKEFFAPTKGWVANQNLSKPIPGGAYLLDNMFPTSETVKLRGGSLKYATIGNGSDQVEAVFSYLTGSTAKLWGATETDIYDVSTVADPDVSPSAAIGSLTSGDWVAVQFQTDAGVYLRIVNGADQSRLFDGSSWSTADITNGATPGDISDDFSHIWIWKQRVFFIEKESLNAWYLAVNSISGQATKLPLGGVFRRGGTLIFGGAWSQEAGDGLNTMCIFVTTEGEVAVYQGTDPSSGTTWSLVGVYRIGRPLGKNAWFQAGGDIMVATDIGLIALSQAVAAGKDFAALTPGAVSWPINTAWNERVKRRNFAPWHCEIYQAGQMLMVAMPSDNDNRPEMLVANANTGAWAGPYTGWDATCLEVFRDRAFFGSHAGKIFMADVTGADDGVPYTGTCVWMPDALGNPAADKVALMGRVSFRSQYEPIDLVFVNAGFDKTLPNAPDAPLIDASSIWGTAVWGEDVWGSGEIEKMPFEEWRSVSAMASTLAPGVRITSGSVASPQTDIVRYDLLYDMADVLS